MKKITFILVFSQLFFWSICSQTDWKKEYDLTERYMQENEISLALTHANKGLSGAESKFGKQSIEYGLSLQQNRYYSI